MIQYSDIVKDERSQRPIEGAQVFVYKVPEQGGDEPQLATLYAADGVTPVANPLTTNNLGIYSFWNPAGELVGDVYVGARLRYRSRLFVGGGYSGSAWTAAAAAQAAAGSTPYANTGAGLAGTSVGQTFWVDNGDGTGTTFRHDPGPVATELGRFIKDQTVSGAATLFAGGVPTTAALASSSGGDMVFLSDGASLQQNMDQRPASDIRAILGGDGAIKPVLDALKAAGVLKAYLAPGSYTLDPGFDMGNMWLEAHPDAVITGTGSTGGTNSLLSSTGSLDALPALSVDPVKGAMTLTYGSAHGLSSGDVINLYNPTNKSWAVFNDVYRAGEWCEVAAVISSTVALLASPLYASYAAADLAVYKASLNRPMVTGGRWFVGDRYFTNFHMCGGGLVDVPFVDADSSTAINLDRCWSPVVRLGTLINRGASSTDDYGVAFGNSQHGRLYAKSIHARRHAVAHGGRDDVGAVPCRDCLTFGAILTNDYSTNVEAADMHGNAELCGFVECNIVGGAKLGGLSPIYRNCTVSATSGGVIARAAQFLGGTVDLRGLQGSTPATTNVSLGFISIVGQDDALTANTKADLNLILTDARISAPNISANQFIVRVKNNGFTGNVNLNIDRIAFDLPAQTIEIVRTEMASGSANSQGIIIDNFSGLPAGSALHNSLSSAYTNVPHRLKPVKTYWDGVTAGAASVTSGNINLPYVFPRVPTDVTLTLGVASGPLDPMAGGTAVAVPYRGSLTASVINLGLRSANNAALGAAYSFRLSYTVGIRDF